MNRARSAGLDRRRFLQRLAAAGLLAVPGAGVLSSCATSGGGGSTAVQGDVSAENPLGVAADAGLDVVIFNGGYGEEYAKFHQELYTKRYPEAEVTHTATTQIAQEMQPRFVAGSPPDVLDDSGAQKIEYATLVSEGQLADLGLLLDAPSWDDPNVKVRDTLLPGVIEQGTFGDQFLILNYVYETYAMWYSKPLFEQNGWAVPTTWDEMTALCEQVKAAGISPFAYGGTNAADYVLDLNLGAAIKQGGMDVVRKIDNLEPGSWTQDTVLAATQGLEEMVAKGYFMPGSEGLKHTEAQTAWTQGQAAFYVSGSWLENEMKGIAPPDFGMTMAPVPALDASAAMPVTALRTQPAEAFLVPARAANVNGGMEYLRLMLSKEGAGRFAELTASVPGVRGATDGIQKTPALESLSAGLDAAGEDVFTWQFRTWYSPYSQLLKTELGNLLAGRSKADGFLAAMQAETDRLAADANVTKYSR
ncbi:N-acetylglucosamine/diacetylchitobiose ABC transporter substrate-binding protein [Pseudonocardia sp. MH-G8]|uniref:N-acetylglucosamine/diacetylchitobiose ABC transporter substrate-binding protein n=1 Tax=Pseudonocardia sp. MH-G8 TaxID=1854588 RepID=UPI000BA055CB|nr:N-acetylglucosamine/diacetylchitobiose ABC transporter substrate-binding protein [Pseudonocardia sp. MH-G8]OZM82191.1 carbohydrate ABC transporter, N-acetylglucosamine/diacetylchitobiose-binding protein [Pseudonocardia sp. MH-G8]